MLMNRDINHGAYREHGDIITHQKTFIFPEYMRNAAVFFDKNQGNEIYIKYD